MMPEPAEPRLQSLYRVYLDMTMLSEQMLEWLGIRGDQNSLEYAEVLGCVHATGSAAAQVIRRIMDLRAEQPEAYDAICNMILIQEMSNEGNVL